ncbi:MAG: hypothetical protein A2W05_08060 [Candidatus Schekmanbacteria bacterium RBG_16_38_10]|uniref:Uncharacterized protein n=1 Tax=Candidatus Schekmanbacteria bacterium RBG_16_38_10 TaxID=1817879 RepID=A0A1F7RQ15_9BACT|nr:MAG: hypothetical protein A2W05_08060 [Candidatus Schekmanbacteria bacterium RBG_16_38_10]
MNRTIFFEIPIQKAYYFLVVALSIFELIDGYFAFHFNLNLIGFIYKSLIVILAMLLFIIYRWDFKIGISIFCGYLLILMLGCFRLLRSDINIEAIVFDFQYTARSFLMLISVFIFAISLQRDKLNNLFSRFVLIQWIVITIAIVVHIIFGFGGVYMRSGEYIRIGYTSFFTSGDTVAILYAVSWFAIMFMVKNNLIRVLITLITLSIEGLFGSKLGILLVFFMLILKLFSIILKKSKLLFLLMLVFGLFSFFLIIMNIENIIMWFLNYYLLISKEGNKIALKAAEYGLLSVLWARRDYLISLAIDNITKYNVKDLIVGANFFNYKKFLGSDIGREFRMTEVDPIDLVGATGILGFIAAYGLLFIIFLMLLKNKQYIKNQLGKTCNNINYVLLYSGILLMLLISSLSSGHVFIEPYSNILLGLVYGLIYKFSKNSERGTKGCLLKI